MLRLGEASNATLESGKTLAVCGFDYTHVAVWCMCCNDVPRCTLVKNRIPKHVFQCLIEIWLAHDVGQRGEFESFFAQQCEEFGIDVRTIGTGSHAGWQQGRAGTVLE